MATLDDGLEREHMVKYAMTVLRMFSESNKNDVVFMLTKQFPECNGHTLGFIVDDARYNIEKQIRLDNK